MITISIVTYNNQKTIKACFESLWRQTIKFNKIVLVDNNSADRTLDIISNYFDERVHVIRLKENVGFGSAHNIALKNAVGEYVLLVNPDLILKENYLEMAIKSMAGKREVGCICGLLLQNMANDKTDIIDSAGLSFTRDRRFLLRYYGKDYNKLDLRSEEVFGCDGALPFYRMELIRDLKLHDEFFDESFFMHKEDWDVSWRARLFGWKTLFEPNCIAWHIRTFRPGNLRIRNQQSDFIRKSSVRNQIILIIKNEQIPNFIFDFFHIVFRQLLILVYLLFKEPKSIKAYFWILKHISEIYRKRSVISKRTRISASSIRQWLYLNK